MLIDTSTEFGQRVERRLKEEIVAWFTTVDQTMTPQPRPIWFLWDGHSFLIYSEPGKAKVAHIGQNPAASLHLDSDGRGGDIITFIGEASVDPNTPLATEVPAYLEKYAADIKRINMTPEQFAQVYSAPIRLRPHKLRGH